MRLFGCLLFIFLGIVLATGVAVYQNDSPVYPIISAENIRQLQSVQTLNFADLPADLVPASGLFAMSADATKVITFGNRSGEAPLSQAVLWGYDNGNSPAVNAIDGESIVRFASDDGRCLYTGYAGHYTVWEMNPASDSASVLHTSGALGDEVVVNVWHNDAEPCSIEIYAEISAADGSAFIVGPDLSVLYPQLFVIEAGDDAAARVGRIEPPLALTMTFEGMLFRWDMNTHQITASVALDELAMFGSVNRAGTHYVWLQTDYAGLHLVDFETRTDRLIATLEPPTYISHLKLAHGADVIIGVDPLDHSGTVSAWLVDSGARIDLGAFRHCERSQPDLAAISHDGTALVIGCDTGIDIWRVVED